MKPSKTIMQRLIFTWFLSLTALVTMAQTGSIRGKINDAKSKEGIIGATIRIDGTNLGTQTDVSGSFVISNVSISTHKVSLTYSTSPT